MREDALERSPRVGEAVEEDDGWAVAVTTLNYAERGATYKVDRFVGHVVAQFLEPHPTATALRVPGAFPDARRGPSQRRLHHARTRGARSFPP